MIVFDNDPDFNKVNLTFEGSNVITNSWVECAYYVNSGWIPPGYVFSDGQQESFMDLLNRYGLISSAVILFIIASYRLTDIIVGPMAMPFYLDMGYSKIEIGSLVKTVALIMSVVGYHTKIFYYHFKNYLRRVQLVLVLFVGNLFKIL